MYQLLSLSFCLLILTTQSCSQPTSSQLTPSRPIQSNSKPVSFSKPTLALLVVDPEGALNPRLMVLFRKYLKSINQNAIYPKNITIDPADLEGLISTERFPKLPHDLLYCIVEEQQHQNDDYQTQSVTLMMSLWYLSRSEQAISARHRINVVGVSPQGHPILSISDARIMADKRLVQAFAEWFEPTQP